MNKMIDTVQWKIDQPLQPGIDILDILQIAWEVNVLLTCGEEKAALLHVKEFPPPQTKERQMARLYLMLDFHNEWHYEQQVQNGMTSTATLESAWHCLNNAIRLGTGNKSARRLLRPYCEPVGTERIRDRYKGIRFGGEFFQFCKDKVLEELSRSAILDFPKNILGTQEKQPESKKTCPFNIDCLTTIAQRERFLFVWESRPTLKEVQEQFDNISRQAWSQSVKSINQKLRGCEIKHNAEESRYRIVETTL